MLSGKLRQPPKAEVVDEAPCEAHSSVSRPGFSHQSSGCHVWALQSICHLAPLFLWVNRSFRMSLSPAADGHVTKSMRTVMGQLVSFCLTEELCTH